MRKCIARDLSYLAAICILCLFPVLSHANVLKYYKYASTDENGDKFFFGESPRFDKLRKYFAVELDEAGRIRKHALHINGKKGWEIIRNYDGTSKYFHELLKLSPNGDRKTIIKIQRNDDGSVFKTEEYDKDGRLIGYVTRKASTSFWNSKKRKVKFTFYNANGEWKSKTTSYFENGKLLKEKYHCSKCQYTISYYDTDTGLVKSSDTKFCNGAFAEWRAFYDSDGLLVKWKGYDKSGKRYAVQEYQDELRVKDEGWRGNEHHVKKIDYDDNRQEKSAEFTINDRFICRFEYERRPTGIVKRTLAYDKEGILIAEYPGRRVLHVDPTGKAYDRRKSIIYKRGKFY